MKDSIFQRLIECGGLYALAAKMYRDDESKSDQFLIECFEQCHNRMAFEYWSAALVMDIIYYRLELIRMPLRAILNEIYHEGRTSKYSKGK